MEFLDIPNGITASLEMDISGGNVFIPGNTSPNRYYGINNEKWFAILTTIPLKDAQRVEFEQFLYGLEGPRNRVQVKHKVNQRSLNLYFPTLNNIINNFYNPVVESSPIIGSEFILVSGIQEPNGTNFIRAGGLISITDQEGFSQLYRIRREASVDNNQSQLQVWPRVRKSYSVGSTIEILEAKASLQLFNDPEATRVTDKHLLNTYVLDFREP